MPVRVLVALMEVRTSASTSLAVLLPNCIELVFDLPVAVPSLEDIASVSVPSICVQVSPPLDVPKPD
jgi:hypothetical protein